MNQYMYFVLGIVLGIAISVYLIIKREERLEKIIEQDRKIFTTKKLDNVMENAVERIKAKIREAKRELTEDEKNEIIAQCCKEKFYI